MRILKTMKISQQTDYAASTLKPNVVTSPALKIAKPTHDRSLIQATSHREGSTIALTSSCFVNH